MQVIEIIEHLVFKIELLEVTLYLEENMVSLLNFLNTDLDYPGIEIKVEFAVMQEYLSHLETGIKAVCDSYVKIEESKFNNAEYLEYQYIYTVAEDYMPRIIRMPFVITIYTLFENSVNELLNFAQIKEEKILGLKDINGKSPTSKYNKYMAHVLNFHFQFNNQVMEEISNINKVRNCIAHANGNLNSLSRDKIKEIKSIEGKKIGITADEYQLDVTYEFLNNSMLIVSDAVENLMEFMETRYGFR